MRRIQTTTVETIGAAVTTALSVIILAGYLADRAGWPIAPWPLMAAGLVAVAGTFAITTRRSTTDTATTITGIVLVAMTFGWLMWLARPTFLPLGSGPDLTHHLLLIDYIERHWQLVHDRAVGLYLGEMTVYTAGSHILIALAGAWTRTSGAHMVHPVVAALVALKVGVVYLIALRILPERVPRVPIAAIGAISHLASPLFFLGSFTEFSFIAQVVSEYFAIAAWWMIAAWNDRHEAGWLLLAGLAAATAFLTWPVVVGPPVVLVAVLVVLSGRKEVVNRSAHALLVIVPVALIAMLFASGRTDMAVIVGTGGVTATPTLAAYGWTFITISTLGLVLAAFDRQARPVALFALAVVLQATALWAFARWNGNVPYMALKMCYLALSVQSVGIAYAAGAGWSVWQRRRLWPAKIVGGASATLAAWALTLVVGYLAVRPITSGHAPSTRDHRPAVSLPLERAGLWARSNIPVGCIEYLVKDSNSAYWLHLAVLGNPRMAERTGDDSTFDLNATLIRWLTPGGRLYAIADLPALPRDVREELDIVQRFDSAVVARRRGGASCPEAP